MHRWNCCTRRNGEGHTSERLRHGFRVQATSIAATMANWVPQPSNLHAGNGGNTFTLTLEAETTYIVEAANKEDSGGTLTIDIAPQ